MKLLSIVFFLLLFTIGCNSEPERLVIATDTTLVPMSFINDKNEIAGRDTDRLVGASAKICYEKTHVLRRVPRRMESLDPDLTDGEDIVVLQKMDVMVTGLYPIVLPVRVALVGQEEPHTMSLTELAGP